MSRRKMGIKLIESELTVETSRSSGPGGQHVNKVETRVQLRFNVQGSKILTESEKELLKNKYAKKLTNSGELLVVSDSKRSQHGNLELAKKKLDLMLVRAFEKKKKRIPTKPSKASRLERVNKKKKHGEKKQMRKKVDL